MQERSSDRAGSGYDTDLDTPIPPAVDADMEVKADAVGLSEDNYGFETIQQYQKYEKRLRWWEENSLKLFKRLGLGGAVSIGAGIAYDAAVTRTEEQLEQTSERLKDQIDRLEQYADSLEDARYTPHPDSVVADEDTEINLREAAEQRIEEIDSVEKQIAIVEEEQAKTDSLKQETPYSVHNGVLDTLGGVGVLMLGGAALSFVTGLATGLRSSYWNAKKHAVKHRVASYLDDSFDEDELL